MNLDFKSWPAAQRLFVAAAFAFSLLWLWSSGYKDAVTFTGFAYVVFSAIRRRERISFGGLGWPILAYVAVCAVSAWTSIDPKFSWRLFWKLLVLIVGFTTLANLLRPGRRCDMAALAVAAAMMFAAVADNLRFAADSMFHVRFLSDGRWSGSRYGFPTIAAAVHAAGFVFCAALLLRAKGTWQRLLCGAGILCTGWLLLAFQTRSVILGIGAGFAVLVLAASRNRKPAFIVIGACTVLFAIALAASPGFRTRLLSGSFSDRLGIWKDARAVIKVEPKMGKYFGIGYGHGIYETIGRKIPNKLQASKRDYDHTHNMVLEALIETGWPGLVTWLALLGTAAWRTIRGLLRASDDRRWTIAAVAAAISVLLVYGQFSAFFALAPIFLFWHLLAILCAAWEPEK